jgi:hypothetical protein
VAFAAQAAWAENVTFEKVIIPSERCLQMLTWILLAVTTGSIVGLWLVARKLEEKVEFLSGFVEKLGEKLEQQSRDLASLRVELDAAKLTGE